MALAVLIGDGPVGGRWQEHEDGGSPYVRGPLAAELSPRRLDEVGPASAASEGEKGQLP